MSKPSVGQHGVDGVNSRIRRITRAESVVAFDNGPVRVMTTHLEYYSGLQRIAQVEAIRARHAEACGHARVDREPDRSESPFRSVPQTRSAILTGTASRIW